MFKKRLMKKLMDWYVSSYIIEDVVFTNAVKLQLPTSMKTHPVVNVSRVVWYKEQVKEQKAKKVKLVKIERVEE